MNRSPLAYPLVRGADTDVGGAADLQTDVMRFMAILALCLVAIFALVQSIPLTPQAPAETPPEPVAVTPELPTEAAPPEPEPAATPEATMPEPSVVRLTRPRWEPRPVAATPTPVAAEEPAPPAPEPAPSPDAVTEPDGFTLRFASDAALMRAVAAHHVGLYAITAAGTRRMTVSESRISFWDASTPNAFHEMEAATVPQAVVDALARSGAATDGVDWGVTLPGRMTARLDELMRQHRGGSLVIGAGGNIDWEAS